ncbi:MAG: gliding motility protein GldM [Flavobacteriales bacterium]|nr:gliding motility protein GldM [Flavobacteriales bacterium]MCZ2443553.1 gliding motility protein GldM [Flavobacteriales bacterium]
MASGKLSPRQKMINMMYLVLTALLALNVSKEILDAFVVVNIGLLQQKQNIEQKNGSWYAEFHNQDEIVNKGKNPRVKDLHERAKKVRTFADEMSAFIHSMKIDLVKNVDGVTSDEEANNRISNPGLIEKKDDYDKPTHYFGPEADQIDKGKARELKNKLNEFKNNLLGLVDERYKTIMEERLALLNTPDPGSDDPAYKKDGKKTWEMKYFYHLPLSAALVELTKWENIVKGAESEMLTHFWDQISATAFKFDAVEAKVIPKSSFVISGSNFEAEVFLAAFSTSFKPTIIYGTRVDSTTMNVADAVQLDSTLIIDGKGHISVPASGAGERTFAGIIKMIDPKTQKETSYPYSTIYNVSPPSATVSPTKMNVFYRGLDNPISVGVPGVAPNNIVVNAAGGSISGSNGTYIVKPGTGNEMTINVSAKMADGKSASMGSFKFRVKRVPTPTVVWANQMNGGKVSGAAGAASPLIPRMDDFDFDVYATIRSFDIAFNVNGSYYSKSYQGNTIPGETSDKIRKLPKGSKIFFDNIKMTVPGNETRTANAVFTIN